MVFTFTSQFQGFGSPKTTLEFEADAIEDVVMYFEQFLRGSGYHFDGNLDLCNITEPAEHCKQDCDGCRCESEQEVSMVMPGTIGSARVVFSESKCNVCGLTKEQLGDHRCYDNNCGMC